MITPKSYLIEPDNMGPGVFLGVCLATVCGSLSFKSSLFSGFQVVVSFLGPISILSLINFFV